MYWKKIVYLDYLEYGEKVKNAGHVKLFLHHEVLSLDVHLKGLYQTDSLLTELVGITKDREVKLGRLCIDKGCCYYNSQYRIDNIDGDGLSVKDLIGVRIRLSEYRCVVAFWEEQQKPAARNIETQAAKPTGAQAVEQTGTAATEQTGAQVVEPIMGQQDNTAIDNTVTNVERADTKTQLFKEDNAGPEQEEAADKIYEDKWQQLCHNYQVVHPFGEETYISLTPKDFVILRQEYQQLVNNSFLLHGYYNYRHLILGKIKNDAQQGYYLGVPGTYYEREKMVAVMFGFEGFESAAERIEPGTFGYYMRRVQI